MDPAHPLPARDSHAQQPPRSILKFSGARRDAHAQSVQFKDLPPLSAPRTSSKSSSRSQKPIQNVGQIPNDGPVPPVTLPATASRNELEIMAFQLAAHLRELRIAEEEVRRQQDAHRLPRPTRRPDDFPEFKAILMGPWAAGSDYGPVLEPTVIVRAHTSVKVHPVFLSTSKSCRLIWDMKLPLETATYLESNRAIGLESIRLQPATSPRLSELCVVSHSFSWAIRVYALEKPMGVTVGDVLHVMSRFFVMPLGDRHLREASPSHRAAVEACHAERVSRSLGPSVICVSDWFLEKSTFDSLVHDPTHTRSDVLGIAGEVYLMLSSKQSQ
ncbi:hypothetical protein BDZ89DRAFT_1064985 [Hymenopellis radicata]|nr:hypothetical protein BDZ89DRAFT_1064985 [Hymenopellis radicata]